MNADEQLKMSVGERIDSWGDGEASVLRVPGGWIFTVYHTTHKKDHKLDTSEASEIKISSVFVPLPAGGTYVLEG